MGLSFLGRGRENPPVELYGKLPIAKDYLRVGCGEGAGRDFREWLDRTFGTVRESSGTLELGEPLRFLGQGEKEPLQGYLWPSTDAGELRSFPFTAFVTRKRKALASDLDQGLGQSESVWQLLAEVREQTLSFSDGQELLAANRGRNLRIDASDRADDASADFDTWVEALWPERGLDGLYELFEKTTRLAQQGVGGPLRLPLVRDLPLRDQVTAWLGVLRGHGVLSPDGLPTLFFPPRSLAPPPELAVLVVASRPLADSEVPWLLPPDEASDLGPGDFAPAFVERPPEVLSPPDGARPLRESISGALEAFGSGKA